MAWTGNKRAFCVLEFAKTESVVMVQWRFQTTYHAEPLTDKTIPEWYMKFQYSGCLCAAKRTANQLSTARCCNVCGRNLITGLTSALSPRVDISSTCKVGQKLGEILHLLICPLRRDHPRYCTTEVGNPGGTYELPCISRYKCFYSHHTKSLKPAAYCL
jgi:hypothetical protein